MRTKRIKAPGEGYYHVISRIVAREWLLEGAEKDIFVEMMRRAEKFSSVDVLTFAVLDDHFHILVRVPEREEVSEDILLKRYEALYGKTKAAALELKWEMLRKSGLAEAVAAEQAILKKRMYDVSEFAKTLKMRYTISYNARHGRTGTLWEGRFKSVLVEPNSPAMRRVATYIDLNAVRAKIVTEPSKYRWCGYAEACRGVTAAIAGIAKILPTGSDGIVKSGAAALREYCSWFGGQTLGTIAFPVRISRFTDGLALGGKEYVDEVRIRTGLAGGSPETVRYCDSVSDIYTLRRPQCMRDLRRTA